jgi:hypothetical protein
MNGKRYHVHSDEKLSTIFFEILKKNDAFSIKNNGNEGKFLVMIGDQELMIIF